MSFQDGLSKTKKHVAADTIDASAVASAGREEWKTQKMKRQSQF